MEFQPIEKPISFGIVGSGTAGLLSALMLRRAFPKSDITIISSSTLGIVGVGEGSTEHWREFMDICNIPLEDMLVKTAATHKYGIRFEGWSNAFPNYFHSVSGDDDIYAFGLYPLYSGILASGKTLTSQTSTRGLVENKIRVNGLHKNTNQYHFDTFKLNSYFVELCFKRSIKMIDAQVTSIIRNAENGCIESVNTDIDVQVSANFWIDASGMRRTLMTHLDNTEWVSFSKYLAVDSAVAAPSPSDESGQIRPYTRAIAQDAGWIWEIPTQERRGNGYVFSSAFCSEDQAIKRLEEQIKTQIASPRTFKFDAGHLKNAWVNNCIATGLSFAFVEPLEATSIGSTIQQLKIAIPYIASFLPNHTASQKHYNKYMSIMMDNILLMIRLHYVSDRRDTEFWKHVAQMPVNDSLGELLDLWKERTPMRHDVPITHGEMFLAAHLFHVAQGQDVLDKDTAVRAIRNMCLQETVEHHMSERRHARFDHELTDHAESLKALWVEKDGYLW